MLPEVLPGTRAWKKIVAPQGVKAVLILEKFVLRLEPPFGRQAGAGARTGEKTTGKPPLQRKCHASDGRPALHARHAASAGGALLHKKQKPAV